MRRRRIIVAALVTATPVALAGCQTDAGTGVIVGGGVGTAVGAIAGNQVGGHWKDGAAIGGVVGATVGYLVGNERDRAKAREW